MRCFPPCLRPVLVAAAIAWAVSLAPSRAQAAPTGEALVIGEAAYAHFPPLPACRLSAHSVAAALRRIGFTVEEQEDASSGAIFAGIATLARRLPAEPEAPVFVYVCSYSTAFDNRPFVLPISAQLSRPADVLTQGILAKALLDAVTRNTRAPAVVAIDAIPAPNAPPGLGLERFAEGLPTSLGLLAVRDTGADDQPTPFAALLVPALKGPNVPAARLLTQLKRQLIAAKLRIAALHLAAEGLYLAGKPAPAASAEVSQPSTAAVAPQAASPAQAPAGTLPDVARMTEMQRKQVQQALAKLGYYDARIDGIFGPDTRAAIRRWQHEKHLPMTGTLNGIQATQLVGR